MIKLSKRNYILMFMDTVLFTNAMAFLSINAVIPYFLNNLGASIFQISLASVIVSACAFITQPFFSGLALKLPYKLKTFVKILFMQRIIFLVFILFIPLISSKSPNLMIITFLIFWGIFNFFVGSYSPFFNLIIAKLVPGNKRGRLLGFAGAFGNFIAIGSSMLIGILLKKIPYPYNYTIIFALGILILLIDVLDFNLMENEIPDKPIDNSISYFQYLKLLPKILKSDKKFVRMVAGSTFFVITNISLAYYILYSIKTYNAGANNIALFTAIGVFVNVLANIFFGIIADRFGHKHVLQYAALCGLTAGVVVITLTGILSVYIAFTLTTLSACGYNLSSNMLIIQEAPKDQLPMYISVNVMITLIISSIIMFFSGFIIEKFSFTPIFSLTIITGFGAFIMFKTFDKKVS